jgi:cytochrome c peroxidase
MINVFDKRTLAVCLIPLLAPLVPGPSAVGSTGVRDDRFLFEVEVFSGNGRTCLTCHSRETGTVSPLDAQRRFAINRQDPLFRHDGSDDGKGHGVQRILTEGTILVELPLPPNVSLADDPSARSVKVRRGIPSTLNTPALDPILMWDGREPNLTSQARNAIRGHAQSPSAISDADLQGIVRFQSSDPFFSSAALREYARGGAVPSLPLGATESEKRGRKFFEDIFDPQNLKLGSCAICHSGPMLNRTNQFFPVPPVGGRFQAVGVSEFNEAKNPVRSFVFKQDGIEMKVLSPDPGRALISGRVEDVNVFKIPSLWGVRRTAPYFHDNSARTLEELAAHYAKLFEVLIPGNPVILTPQDQADIVAYLKLLE